jgi:hypothetical protein
MKQPYSRRDREAAMRALAIEKGFAAKRAPTKVLWVLTDERTGEKAVEPTGTTAFTEQQALKFLKALPTRD